MRASRSCIALVSRARRSRQRGEGGEDQSANVTDPCAKIKAQMAIANITAKIEELRKKQT